MVVVDCLTACGKEASLETVSNVAVLVKHLRHAGIAGDAVMHVGVCKAVRHPRKEVLQQLSSPGKGESSKRALRMCLRNALIGNFVIG